MRDALTLIVTAVRARLHVGEVEARGADIGGIAVHVAARILDQARPGEILVSRTLTDFVAGTHIGFFDRGERELHGVRRKWQLFAVA